MSDNTANRILGGCVIILALLAIFVWIPNDTATGLIFKQRGRLSIGDAMAPTLAFGLIGLAGILIALEKRKGLPAAHIVRANIQFLAILIGVFLLSIALMRWSGPVAVLGAKAFGLTSQDYRDLRDTVPWKYVGFVIGGTTLVATLMTLMEGRFTWRAIWIGLLAVAGLIVVFDLPFPDLLLPPNGDL